MIWDWSSHSFISLIYLGNGMNNFKMEIFTFSKRTTLDSWKKSGIQHIKMCVTHWRWKAIINSRPKIQSGILRWNYENGRFHNLENDMQVCPIFYKLNKIYAPSTNSNVLLNLQSVCSICNNNISLYLIILSLQSSVVPKIIHYQRERRNFKATSKWIICLPAACVWISKSLNKYLC